MACKHLGILNLGTLHQLPIHHYMQVFACLCFYGLCYRRMPVPDVAYADTTNEIKVLTTTGIMQIVALRRYDLYTEWRRRGLCQVLLEKLTIVHKFHGLN